MSCSDVQTPILSCVDGQNIVSATECHKGLSKSEVRKEEIEKDRDEEEEDEDVDFNPFLKETPSREASSSLSSEIDGFGGDVADSGVAVGTKISKVTNVVDVSDGEDSEPGEEWIVLQTTASPHKASKKGKKEHDTSNIKSPGISQEEGNEFHSNLVLDDAFTKESSNVAKSRKPVIEIDNEDAICTRTRARYSLASFTLDELETFLQESDDDDDLQNVDDEEEYRKFLASVLLDGDDANRSAHVNENVDDDEDNDADFEIELEELLESDLDETAPVKTPLEYGRAARPQTRQNRRQRGSSQSEKKLYGHVNKPLRPLLPSVPNQWAVHGKSMVAETAFLHPSFASENSADNNGLINGFTPQQIGQLYTLIHEHVQLLIQVFSLCAIDSSRQHIASQVRGLMSEILHKRDEVLTSKGVSYPSNCFSPLFLSSSVSDGSSKFVQTECNSELVNTSSKLISQSSQIPFKGRSEHEYVRQGNTFLNVEGSFWVPHVRGPVHSLLDVAPLDLVAKYVDDVYNASLEHRQRYLECNSDTRIKEEPLFPLPLPSGVAANSEGSCGSVSHVIHTGITAPSQPPPKKTMAAVLVENTKKQSIALVPKEVAKLAQRFFPLFNPALFPHKPPPAVAVQRILFTDSEDELLALGLMEYNNDWKAIQKRFLPCKSTHQIFVRQKNRASSKAPENAIKTVRRMKTSPLTVEEIIRIQEGLVVYKFDWMSIWKYIVPYRDVSLLPRLWRIANGTQKSYKLNAAQKEQRRLYESKRRKCQLATSENGDIISVREGHQANKDGRGGGRDAYPDNPEVAYVHQAFLADWRPASSTLNSTYPYLGSREKNPTVGSDVRIREQQNHYLVSGQAPPQSSCIPPFLSGIRREHISSGSTTSNMESVKCSCPNHSQRVNNTRLVRLAPNLAPVNLPRSVRVVSQAAFKGNQHKAARVCSTGNAVDARSDTSGPHNCLGEKMGTAHLGEVSKDNMQGSVIGSQLDKIDAEGEYACDFQMHPLLFRSPQNGNEPVHLLKFCSSTSDTHRTQPQLNLTLFHDPPQKTHNINHDEHSRKFKSNDSSETSYGIDFHPLLQKATDTQSRSTYHTFQTKTLVSNGGVYMGKQSTCSSEKPKEVDLEMTLSSRFGKEKAVSDLPSDAHPSVISSDIIRCNVDDIVDQSQVDIVMEQEELSDSDEDIEENVEFECEEMADSDGDEVSGLDLSTEGQNKLILSNSTIYVQKHDAGVDIRSEALADSNTQVDAHLPYNVSSQSMVITRQRKERAKKISWLSLDSHLPEFPSPSNTMQEGVSTDQADSGSLSTTPSSKSSKKVKISSKGVQEKHALIAAEHSLEPVAFPMSGRSRKRRGREE